MILYIVNKGKNLNKVNQDNIFTALGDWLILGQQTGFRRKEWAQDRTYLKKFNDIERNIDNSSAAFILKDFEFRAKGNKQLNNFSQQEINRSSIVNIKWRFQKNNDNGQIISYVKDINNKHICVVKACKRIRKRALRLKIHHEKPIAVYSEFKHSNKVTSFIDDVHIKTILQEAARKEYNIKCQKELSAFTSYSIRVGVCVLLHTQNVSTEDIKFRLRWISDTFRMYLRNIQPLAERHKDAIAHA